MQMVTGSSKLRLLSHIHPPFLIRPHFPVEGLRKESKAREGPVLQPLCQSVAWCWTGPSMRELFLQPDGEDHLPARSRALLLQLPHLPCQDCPDGPFCTPAKYSSGSQGGPEARALHGETLMALSPLGLSESCLKPGSLPLPHSQGSFPLNLTGLSQHFYLLPQTS